ncbi:GSCFA domain-containing protein [Methylocella sp.]|uniref:GSCFA domain-containing protein n=1 Tax=Methylocella sp. TaxID=1978226 RepID=UPI003784385C
MKIVVGGNCQAVHGLGPSVRAMVPEAEVTVLHVAGRLPDPFPEADVIFLQTYLLQQPQPKGVIHPAPGFYYPGFHPDLIYCGVDGRNLQSPLDDYNSALAIYGWLRGLSVKDTARLFCEPVFERLGYFDYCAIGDRALVEEGERARMDLSPLLARWKTQGCFAYSVNHPKLFVCADVAARLLAQAGVPISAPDAAKGLHDGFGDGSVWPLYPEIGARMGLPGDYTFKCARGVFDLESFIARSFEMYAATPREKIQPTRFIEESEKYRDLERLVAKRAGKADNPYAGLPDSSYWRRAMTFGDPAEVDLVAAPKFAIEPSDAIATAGSCFAQHLAKTLIANANNYFYAELPPPGMSALEAAGRGYGVFSARYGNIYTVRQLLQLFQRAYGEFEPVDVAWRRSDGRFIDPFRPQIAADGFGSPEEVAEDRRLHLAGVRRVFEESRVFIFTAGLTEGWIAAADGAAFPVAPGAADAPQDPAAYRFVNFRVAEIEADLELFIARLKGVNPGVKLIFTVSPVPLVATYERRNVVVATTYSKSALRAAVEEVVRDRADADYFPSYEVITSWYNRGRYFADDLRSVTPEGVAHVMRLFSKHYLGAAGGSAPDAAAAVRAEIARAAKIVCDEELLDNGA